MEIRAVDQQPEQSNKRNEGRLLITEMFLRRVTGGVYALTSYDYHLN